MKKIMTPELFYKMYCYEGHMESNENHAEECIEFAKYYARAIIESLTDDEIEKKYPMRDITGSPKSLRNEIHYTNNMAYKRKEGAQWAKEELLKRIE